MQYNEAIIPRIPRSRKLDTIILSFYINICKAVHTVHTTHGTHSTHSTHYTRYTPYTQYTLHTVHTVHTVHTTHGTHSTHSITENQVETPVVGIVLKKCDLCVYHVGTTNFSLWRHSIEQVCLGYTHNKSQHRLRIRGIVCLLFSPTSVNNLHNHPMFTILWLYRHRLYVCTL